MKAIGDSSKKTLDVNEVKAELTDFRKHIDSIKQKADKAVAAAAAAESEISKIREEMDSMKKDLENLGRAPAALMNNQVELRDIWVQLERQDGYSRQFNWIVDGILESETETYDKLHGTVSTFDILISNLTSAFDLALRQTELKEETGWLSLNSLSYKTRTKCGRLTPS